MKSEHRHELQTNDLSKLTQKTVAKFEEHGLIITVVLCLAAVTYAGVSIYRSNTTTTRAAAWTDFVVANSPGAYTDLAEDKKFQGTAAADWARLVSAESRLAQAIQGMFTDRVNAVSELEESSKDFQKLVENNHQTIKERALFGLARAEESLGNLEAATEAYATLAGDEFAKSVYNKEAKERAKYLTQADPQAFYSWFKKQNPKPPEPAKPQDGTAPGGSGLQLPETLPFGAGLSPTPPAEKPADTSEADKKLPKLGEPAAEKPVDGKPADKPSATDAVEKPTEKTEATEKDAGGSKDSSESADKAEDADKDEAAEKPDESQ